MNQRNPRPNAIGIRPTLGKLEELARHLEIILELEESQLSVSDGEGVGAELSWSSQSGRLEVAFPFRAEQRDKARRIHTSLREAEVEPLARQGKPSFRKAWACELEPDREKVAAVVRHVLARALEVESDDLVAYMALNRETGQWLPLE